MRGGVGLVQNGEYMSKLLKVFNDSEDLEDEESLRLLCHIFKAIVGLNDATLLEVRRYEAMIRVLVRVLLCMFLCVAFCVKCAVIFLLVLLCVFSFVCVAFFVLQCCLRAFFLFTRAS